MRWGSLSGDAVVGCTPCQLAMSICGHPSNIYVIWYGSFHCVCMCVCFNNLTVWHNIHQIHNQLHVSAMLSHPQAAHNSTDTECTTKLDFFFRFIIAMCYLTALFLTSFVNVMLLKCNLNFCHICNVHILCYNIKNKILKLLVKLATTFENYMLWRVIFTNDVLVFSL